MSVVKRRHYLISYAVYQTIFIEYDIGLFPKLASQNFDITLVCIKQTV